MHTHISVHTYIHVYACIKLYMHAYIHKYIYSHAFSIKNTFDLSTSVQTLGVFLTFSGFAGFASGEHAEAYGPTFFSGVRYAAMIDNFPCCLALLLLLLLLLLIPLVVVGWLAWAVGGWPTSFCGGILWLLALLSSLFSIMDAPPITNLRPLFRT